jgi:hypothetical protein
MDKIIKKARDPSNWNDKNTMAFVYVSEAKRSNGMSV